MGLVVFVDVNLGEEGLVEQAAGSFVGLEVRGVAVAGELEGVGEELLGCVVVGGGAAQGVVDVVELACDALLLSLEEVEGDRAGVVGVEQFLALGGEFDALLLDLSALGGRVGVHAVEVVEDELLDLVAEGRAQGDGAVLVLDELFDRVGGHGLALAVGGASFPTGAEEVGVDVPPTVLGVDHHEPRVAAAAEEAAAQVVQVTGLEDDGVVVGGEEGADERICDI